MPEFRLNATVTRPVSITVEAPTLEDALDRAEFQILNENSLYCKWGDTEIEFEGVFDD